MHPEIRQKGPGTMMGMGTMMGGSMGGMMRGGMMNLGRRLDAAPRGPHRRSDRSARPLVSRS
jgi:hypothetical protein